jgi:hypothetical protein
LALVALVGLAIIREVVLYFPLLLQQAVVWVVIQVVQHQVALAVEAQVLILRALLAHLVRALQVALVRKLETTM